MEEQMTLFRPTDPHTSREAAESIEHKRTAIQKEVEAFALIRPNGFTDDELTRWFGNHGSTYRSRRNELTKEGVIVPTDERRRLPSGRRAVVWIHHTFEEISR